MNKIDRVPELAAGGPRIERGQDGLPAKVYLSAREGQGLDLLRAALAERLAATRAPAPFQGDEEGPRSAAEADEAGNLAASYPRADRIRL